MRLKLNFLRSVSTRHMVCNIDIKTILGKDKLTLKKKNLISWLDRGFVWVTNLKGPA